MKTKELKMEDPKYTTTELCDVFEINQSIYYDQVKQRPVQQQLKPEGINIDLHKTARMMKMAEIAANKPKKYYYYPMLVLI